MVIQCVETVVSFFTLAQKYPRTGFPSADVKDIDELRNLLFQQNKTCYVRNMTETCPKITALEHQQKFIEFDEM